MANNAWLAAPIAIVVLYRLATGGASTTATTPLLILAMATFGGLVGVGLILRRLGVRSRAVGAVLAAVFWLSTPNLTWPRWTGGTRIEPDPITLSPATRQRDLIVVVIDDHPSSTTLLVEHGYDNAEFQLELSTKGFRVVPEAWSNSSDPFLAITSALSGRYPGTPRNELDRRRLSAMLEGDNPVADLLRANGYVTTHLGAPSAVTAWFGDGLGSVTVDRVANALDATSDNETPDFVFAHLGDCDPEPAGSANAPDAVVARALCNNRRIGRILEGGTPADAVVVIAGTRGAVIDDDLGDNPAAWPRSAIVHGLGVFSAIRLAPDCRPPPDDATVAVIVHHGVACALGVQPNPAPEQAVVVKGGVLPDDALEVNLNVLRSSLAGQNLRKAQ